MELAWSRGTDGLLAGGEEGASKSQSREVFARDDASVVGTGVSAVSTIAGPELFKNKERKA